MALTRSNPTPTVLGGPAPTAPWGWPGDQVLSVGGRPSQAWREVPELTWPDSLRTYARMARDPMVGSVEQAIATPILRTGWHLGDADVDPMVSAFVASELGLDDPETGRTVRDAAGGVSWRTLLGDLLLSLRYGHMIHEFVFAMRGQLVGFAKIAPRDPRSIESWWTDDQGEVLGVTQMVAIHHGQMVPDPNQWGAPRGTIEWHPRTIEGARLLIHTHRSEAGDPLGRSIFENMFRPWFVKDHMQRFGLVAADRASTGIPVYKRGQTTDKQAALELVRGIRAGEESGAVIEADDDLEVLALDAGMDLLPWLKWADEQIAQGAQAMMLTLGHDAGARSLGDTFADIFARSLDGVVDDIETTVTEKIIRPLVELNFGPGTAYPTLVGDAIQSDSPAVLNSLGALVDKGIITADQQLEDSTRRRMRLPKADQTRTAAEREAAANPVPAATKDIAKAASNAVAMAEKIITSKEHADGA